MWTEAGVSVGQLDNIKKRNEFMGGSARGLCDI